MSMFDRSVSVLCKNDILTKKKPGQTVQAQTVDKALLLQGFAIVGTAFLI